MKPHLHLLAKLDACREARAFAKTCPDLETAWNTCDRSDWLVWLLRRLGYDDAKVYRLYACWCVRNTPLADGRKVWDLLTDPRSRNAVEVAERFAVGEATVIELRDADYTAYAAYAAYTAAAYAAYTAAANAAAANAAYAAYAAYACVDGYADAAANAAKAAAYTYAAAANAANAANAAAYTYAAKLAAWKAHAQQLREMVPFAIVAGLAK